MSQRIDAERLLAEAPLFAGLDDKSLERLAGACVRRSYPEGSRLLEEGSVGLGMIVVASGRVEVAKGSGAERQVLAVLGPGEIVGEMALFDDRPRSASAVALEPVEALLLARESFRDAVEKDPEILWRVVPTLTARLRESQERQRAAAAAGEPLPDAAAKAASGTSESGAPPKERSRRAVDLDESLVQALRIQYAMMRGSLAAFSGMIRAGESFLESFARQTGLRDAPEIKELVDRMPDALASAARSAVTESENVADEALEAYRRHSHSA